MEHDGPQLEHGGPRSMFRLWSAVVYLWSAVFPPWSAVFRQWSAVFRPWSAVFRLWSAVFQPWSAVLRPGNVATRPCLWPVECVSAGAPTVLGLLRLCFDCGSFFTPVFELWSSSPRSLVCSGPCSATAMACRVSAMVMVQPGSVVAPSFAWPRLSHGRRVRDFIVFF